MSYETMSLKIRSSRITPLTIMTSTPRPQVPYNEGSYLQENMVQKNRTFTDQICKHIIRIECGQSHLTLPSIKRSRHRQEIILEVLLVHCHTTHSQPAQHRQGCLHEIAVDEPASSLFGDVLLARKTEGVRNQSGVDAELGAWTRDIAKRCVTLELARWLDRVGTANRGYLVFVLRRLNQAGACCLKPQRRERAFIGRCRAIQRVFSAAR